MLVVRIVESIETKMAVASGRPYFWITCSVGDPDLGKCWFAVGENVVKTDAHWAGLKPGDVVLLKRNDRVMHGKLWHQYLFVRTLDRASRPEAEMKDASQGF